MQTPSPTHAGKRVADYAYVCSVARNVHRALGPGLLENIYHKAIVLDLLTDGMHCECERVLPILYRNTQIGTVRADIVLDNTMVVELKAILSVKPEHLEQVRRYGRLLHTDRLMLINFPSSPDKQLEIYTFSEGDFRRNAPL